MQLLDQLSKQYPQFTFESGSEFRWSPEDNTIYYHEDDSEFSARLLHELAHALLRHTSYSRDVDLVAIERDAWRYAKITLAPDFHMTIPADTIENDLDSYRDWLHARSTCPKCQATGLQVSDNSYCCLVCATSWRVNEARRCGLKRYKITP